MLLLPAPGPAHPMGNFSISHYTRFTLGPNGVELTYALDFAELPTFELLQEWNLEEKDRGAIEARAVGEARRWLSGLRISADGRAVAPVFRRAAASVSGGAGGLPVLLVTMHASLPVSGGALIEYEDANYPDRAGWKEIVTPGETDRSQALRQYPTDASAPPQQVKASFRWGGLPAATIHPAPPPPPAVESPAPAQPAAPASGTVVRGDYLSRMLGGREITPAMLFIGLCVAFGLGAMHALSPGHGKTIVAAYLVGTRGTMRHALLLGGLVTFTHTISVFALGLGVLFFERYVAPEKVIPALGVVSGLSIMILGGYLLYQRAMALAPGTGFYRGPIAPHDHTHVPEGPVTTASLIALGVSGGLVPCPSALVLLLSSIALGRVTLGLSLLLAFSLGLAVVLMGIGAIVLYAKHLLPERTPVRAHWVRFVPVGSAAVVMLLGLLMTGISMGWIPAGFRSA